MLPEQIFQWVGPVVVAALAGLAAALAAFLIRLARQQFGQAQWRMIEEAVGTAVAAAEQYGGANEDKKRQALQLAQDALALRGVHLSLYELDVAVEAAVWREIGRFRGGKLIAVSSDGQSGIEEAT